jgi:Mg-chelatase subunit ChlD
MTGAMAFGKYAAATEEDTHALIHIEAPKYVADEEKERGTLDIVAVVDVSGSMGGSKLELARTTLEFIVENLTEKDRLCIVAYDSSVSVPLDLKKMDEAGKTTAMDKIKALRAGSCTNLSGGLFRGIDIVKGRPAKSKASVTSVLLMTDGEANEGIVGDDLIKATRKKIGENPDFSLYTFGYGASHNEHLLKNLSEVGSGMYYFIENNDIIPESFGDCLGGLLSVVAQNMKVSFTTANGAVITKIHTKRRQTLADDGKSGSVTLNDI